MSVFQRIRFFFASYFASKAWEYLKTAWQIRANYPEGSIGYQYAPFYEAWADVAYELAKSIAGDAPTNADAEKGQNDESN